MTKASSASSKTKAPKKFEAIAPGPEAQKHANNIDPVDLVTDFEKHLLHGLGFIMQEAASDELKPKSMPGPEAVSLHLAEHREEVDQLLARSQKYIDILSLSAPDAPQLKNMLHLRRRLVQFIDTANLPQLLSLKAMKKPEQVKEYLSAVTTARQTLKHPSPKTQQRLKAQFEVIQRKANIRLKQVSKSE